MRFSMPSWSPLIALFLAAAAFASQKPEITIPKTDTPPTLNDFVGMQPTAAIAAKMAHVTGFTQREPHDGKPISFETHAYLAYDAKKIYVVFVCFDPEPEKIRARMSPRERVFGDDLVNIQLDTFNDQRRGYTFLSNPHGIQWDAIWTEGKDYDASYDASWQSQGRLTDQGYLVRIAIPFTTLRFAPKAEQTWGIMLNRDIRRLNEESFWPRYTLAIQGRINQAAVLKGIRDVQPGRNIRLNPYVFARNIRVLDPKTATYTQDDFDPEVGLDAKMVIRDSFVLDVTANPDFSQVESDEPQVTVNQRFEVRFPEKRPFFLENADFFQTFTNLVFTRRIIDPNGGLRFTGKKAGWSVGVMAVDDKAPGQGRTADDVLADETAEVGIVRLNRDLRGQSTVGVLYTHRKFGPNNNRVAAVDGRLRAGDHWLAEYQVAHSRTERFDETLEGNSYQVMVNRNGPHLNMHNHFLRTDPNFITELGFLNGDQRPNSLNFHHSSEYTWRPEGGNLVAWGLGGRVGRTWDVDHETLDTFFDPELEFEWRDNSELEINYNYNEQRFTQADFPQLSGDTILTDSTARVGVSGEISSLFTYSGSLRMGQGINLVPRRDQQPEEADLFRFETGLGWTPISPLRIDLNYFYFKLEDQDAGDAIFTNSIARLRANWQFTREWSLRLISQLDDLDPNNTHTFLERGRNWNNDLLLRYVVNPWTALYLGYNNNDRNFQIIDGELGPEVILSDDRLSNDGRQFFLKFSYLFQY